MITKDPRKVIHQVAALEEYLDRYLQTSRLTFEEWAQTFGEGSYRDRNLLILDLATPFRPRSVLEFACAGPFLARLLLDNVQSIEKYTCSNFSRRMVEFCAAQLADQPRCVVTSIDADVKRSSDMHRDHGLLSTNSGSCESSWSVIATNAKPMARLPTRGSPRARR